MTYMTALVPECDWSPGMHYAVRYSASVMEGLVGRPVVAGIVLSTDCRSDVYYQHGLSSLVFTSRIWGMTGSTLACACVCVTR